MCGICGIVFDRETRMVDPDSLHIMNSVLTHRGPDDEGTVLQDNVGLAVRRLSIIDLTGGHQPIHNENKTVWVVFNGEIYNFRELRCELIKKGHTFYTHSDTEVIVHLYEEYGQECVKQLTGMFAFALWDVKQKTLFLFRDRLGIKPLYYYHRNGCFLFASEMKALLQHPEVGRDINVKGLDCYFTYGYIPAPYSIFESIYKLPPGTFMTLCQGEVRMERYWDLEYTNKLTGSIEELSEQLLERLRDSIRRHLISDVPLGAFLSGGVDSSTIVALMSEEMREPVKTFSLGYQGHRDELGYARLVATLFDTDHHEFIVSPDMAELLPDLVWNQDEPFFDNSMLPTYLVSQLAKEHVTVALSGDGGDELFGGYEWTRRYQFIRYYNRLPQILRTAVHNLLLGNDFVPAYQPHLMSKLRRFLHDTTLSLEEGFARRTTVPVHFKDQLYSPELKNSLFGYNALHIQKDCFAQARFSDEREKMLYVDTMLYLPDDCLFKVDRMSMANSLEVRVPFLDHSLVEFASRLPFSSKVAGIITKRILKKAMANRLPKPILRQRKQGFTLPIAHWLRGDLGNLVSQVTLGKKTTKRGLLNPQYLRWMLEAHRNGSQNFAHRIWAIFVFEIWARLYLDHNLSERPKINLKELI